MDFWLLIILIVAAITALQVRDLLAAVVALSAYSFLMALLFAQLGAIDVSFVEATLGAGLSGVFFVVALFAIKRRYEK